MKTILPILVALGLGYLGFVFWQNRKPETAPPPSVAAETPPPAPAATPEPIAAAPEPHRNLAPPGTYYIVQRVSVTTDSSIIGILPGTKVTMVNAGPPLHVTDGQNQFDVQPDQVTNDLDIAAKAYYADQNAQSALHSMTALQAQQASQKEQASEKAWAAKQRALAELYAPAPMSMSTGELNEAAKPVNSIEGGGGYRSAIH